jgi:group I intron endonuclease
MINENIWEEKNLIDQNQNLLLKEKNDNLNIIIETKKKSTKKRCNDIGGIYKIINKIDGKYYVGSSQNIRNRLNKHKLYLKKNAHWNKHLQNAYNKYGIDTFEYIIVELVSEINQLLKTEQKYLDECKNNPDNNYMIAYDAIAPMRGKCLTIETKEKISSSNKGKKRTEEYKRKLSDSRIGNNNPMCEKKYTLSELLKKSEISKNLWKNNDYRNKHTGIKNYNFGKPKNEKTKEKISLSNKGKKRNEITKLKLSISHSGKKHKDYNHTVYKWYNQNNNICENCTQYDLIKKYNLVASNITRLISKERKSHRGWIFLGKI